MSEMFDDLKELKAMLENGEVTPSEYDKLKVDLLADKDAAPKEPVNLMSGKPPGWYFDPSGTASNQAYWDGNAWTGQTRPRPGMKNSTTYWIAGIIAAAIIFVLIGVAATGSSFDRDGGGSQSVSQSPPVTTAAQGYQSRYGGETSVYTRILGMTDCNALQAQFDIAGDNNDLADPGTAAHKRTLGYMTAADDTMEKRGCYG